MAQFILRQTLLRQHVHQRRYSPNLFLQRKVIPITCKFVASSYQIPIEFLTFTSASFQRTIVNQPLSKLRKLSHMNMQTSGLKSMALDGYLYIKFVQLYNHVRTEYHKMIFLNQLLDLISACLCSFLATQMLIRIRSNLQILANLYINKTLLQA